MSAVNYGLLPKDLDAAVSGACPIVASYGAKDRTLGGAAAGLETALTSAGVKHDVKEYPSAGHAFLDDADPGPRLLHPLFRAMGIRPDPVSAPDAWRRIEEYLADCLAGDGRAHTDADHPQV